METQRRQSVSKITGAHQPSIIHCKNSKAITCVVPPAICYPLQNVRLYIRETGRRPVFHDISLDVWVLTCFKDCFSICWPKLPQYQAVCLESRWFTPRRFRLMMVVHGPKLASLGSSVAICLLLLCHSSCECALNRWSFQTCQTRQH
jgi:hypothetical protein